MNTNLSQIEYRYSRPIPFAQKEYIQQFEKFHTFKSLRVNEIIWNYFDSGTDAEVLLLLHGGFVEESIHLARVSVRFV